MEVNIIKSSILFNGLEEESEMKCKLILPFNSIPFDDVVKYHDFQLKPNDWSLGRDHGGMNK
jgi:hypothetical protein